MVKRALIILLVLGLLSLFAPFLQFFAERSPEMTEAALESVLVLGIFLFLRRKPALLPIQWEPPGPGPGARPGARRIYGAWFVAVPVLALSSAAFIHLIRVATPFEASDWFYMICFAPVIEELFFRQIVLDAFIRRNFGLRQAALWNGLLFGIYHLQGLLLGKKFAVFVLLQSALAGLLGVVFAWSRTRSGSLIPGMALHAFFNGVYLGTTLLLAAPLN